MQVTTHANAHITDDTGTSPTKHRFGSGTLAEVREAHTDIGEWAGGRFSIAGSSGPVTLSFGAVSTVKGWFLEADGALTVTVDGNARTLAKGSTAASFARIFEDCSISSLTVTNAGSDAVVYRYAVWGD